MGNGEIVVESVELFVLRKLKSVFNFDVGFHTESAIFSTILALLLKNEILDFSIPDVYQVPRSRGLNLFRSIFRLYFNVGLSIFTPKISTRPEKRQFRVAYQKCPMTLKKPCSQWKKIGRTFQESSLNKYYLSNYISVSSIRKFLNQMEI